MTENKLERKEIFHCKIENYYSEITGNQIPTSLLTELVDKITENQYDNYTRFWNQYPKSRKRYSEFKIDDLEHPFTHYMITDFLKFKDYKNYTKYSLILLKMTEKEFSDYELRKYQYDTK